jgi:hypothetical protein
MPTEPPVLPTMPAPPTTVSLQPTPTPSPTPNATKPVIDGTEPGGVMIGHDITIRGHGFGDQAGHVLFTGKLTTAQIWSDTHIIVTVPDGATDGTIRIRRADGVFSNAVGFAPLPTPTTSVATEIPTATLTPTPGPPRITELSRQQAATDSALFVLGANFGLVPGQVLVGSAQALVDANGWSDTSISVRVPFDALAGAQRISVRRGTDGQISNFACLQVILPTPTTVLGSPTPTPASTPTVTTSC